MLQLRTTEVRGSPIEAGGESLTPIGRWWAATMSTPWGVFGRHYVHPVRVESSSGDSVRMWDFIMIAKLVAVLVLLGRRRRA